jgi:hypothetical protein
MNSLTQYFARYTSAAPLAVFRIIFGLLMLVSLVRFTALGWIEKLYLEPRFHFSYYGFSWVKPLGDYTYLLFLLAGIAAFFIMLGYRYRLSIILFFLSFTYVELMDKTTYLNHYYFVSVMSFLLIFLPAQARFSLDAIRRPALAAGQVPAWTIDAIKLMLAIVYFYAGLAKLNSDWLLHAQPLAIWLPTKYDLPLIGSLLREDWVPYAFSWSGAAYDLLIPFLLWFTPTRKWAFVAVIIFHLLTRLLFPIGMFPYIMIGCTLIFFSADVHESILQYLKAILHKLFPVFRNREFATRNREFVTPDYKPYIVATFLGLQLLLPFRYTLYPGELFWTEQGYRFSWRVMLMEKAGYAQFRVVDKSSGRQFYVQNGNFLNPFQEKQMATQPDFILEYAHFLARHYQEKGEVTEPAVYVDSYVALNGRSSRRYIDPEVDLVSISPSFRNKNWILPFEDDIKGF